MRISKLTIATTTTITTTLGSLKLWLPTTNAAAMLRCAVPNARTRRVLISGSAEQPADNEPSRNEEYSGENTARAEHCHYVADVRDRDQHDQQNKAQV